MRITPFIPAYLIFSVVVAQAQAPANGFCVENQDDRPALFVVDAGESYRAVATLAPDERLCTPAFEAPTNGFVSIFYDENALEGCSRLTSAGTVQVLIKYADFDNCTWQ